MIGTKVLDKVTFNITSIIILRDGFEHYDTDDVWFSVVDIGYRSDRKIRNNLKKESQGVASKHRLCASTYNGI